MSVPFPGAIEFRHRNPGHSFASFDTAWNAITDIQVNVIGWRSSQDIQEKTQSDVLETVSLWEKKGKLDTVQKKNVMTRTKM